MCTYALSFQASYLDCLIRPGWKVDQNNRSHYLHSHVSFIYRVYRLDFSPLFAANLPLARVNHPIPIIKSDATLERFILHLHPINFFNSEEKITSEIYFTSQQIHVRCSKDQQDFHKNAVMKTELKISCVIAITIATNDECVSRKSIKRPWRDLQCLSTTL